MRFEGILNVDLNEITMNLVPYPDLHFLISSLHLFILSQTQSYNQERKFSIALKTIF